MKSPLISFGAFLINCRFCVNCDFIFTDAITCPKCNSDVTVPLSKWLGVKNDINEWAQNRPQRACISIIGREEGKNSGLADQRAA
jgi:hypothetical protein